MCNCVKYQAFLHVQNCTGGETGGPKFATVMPHQEISVSVSECIVVVSLLLFDP
jgi:hypothetical protein